MSEKQHVALVKRACPVCCAESDAELLLATRYHRDAKGKMHPLDDLGPMHRQVIGWTDKPCEKCREQAPTGLYFVVVKDGESGTNPERTGWVFALKREACERMFTPDTPVFRTGWTFIEDSMAKRLVPEGMRGSKSN